MEEFNNEFMSNDILGELQVVSGNHMHLPIF